MNFLFLIPARGGSKGIPDKNIKPLLGKPLIYYTIDAARQIATDENICVSTDSSKIKETAEAYGLHVPFLRPNSLATDTASTYDVIIHALSYYKEKNIHYDAVVLLQPTSPLRKSFHIKEAIALYEDSLDMVVSVFETKSNPYYVLFEENGEGFLKKSKEGNFIRRQDCPKIYELNGAIYVMNVKSLQEKNIRDFERIKKYVMDFESSVDIDLMQDWTYAEFILNHNQNS